MNLADVPQLTTINGIAWLRSSQPVPYLDAVAAMARRVENIAAGKAAEAIWLLEHPPVYTAGVSARPEELRAPGSVPVVATARGGRYTFHGPGQRIVYVMLDLRRRGRDLRRLVTGIEDWIIAALAGFGIAAERREGRIGIWVPTADGGEAKIGAIGLRLRRWVSSHGVAINVCPNLAYFDGIVPCGLAGFPVTSLHRLGCPVSLQAFDQHLLEAFRNNFLANPSCALDAGRPLSDEGRDVGFILSN